MERTYRFIQHLKVLQYSAEKDDADVVIRFGGKEFDPTKTENNLSLLLARKTREEIIYSYDPEEKFCNIINAQIH